MSGPDRGVLAVEVNHENHERGRVVIGGVELAELEPLLTGIREIRDRCLDLAISPLGKRQTSAQAPRRLSVMYQKDSSKGKCQSAPQKQPRAHVFVSLTEHSGPRHCRLRIRSWVWRTAALLGARLVFNPRQSIARCLQKCGDTCNANLVTDWPPRYHCGFTNPLFERDNPDNCVAPYFTASERAARMVTNCYRHCPNSKAKHAVRRQARNAPCIYRAARDELPVERSASSESQSPAHVPVDTMKTNMVLFRRFGGSSLPRAANRGLCQPHLFGKSSKPACPYHPVSEL